ncbi:MAG: DUF1289 domain-containing protein [Bacteroidales bacterium]|nr:DUF1289 domain-containing protein [Bacteroidales bacterium]
MFDIKNIKCPCIDKCKYDEDKICMGCHRTMHEIVSWSDFSDDEKIKIIQRVEKKMKL